MSKQTPPAWKRLVQGSAMLAMFVALMGLGLTACNGASDEKGSKEKPAATTDDGKAADESATDEQAGDDEASDDAEADEAADDEGDPSDVATDEDQPAEEEDDA